MCIEPTPPTHPPTHPLKPKTHTHNNPSPQRRLTFPTVLRLFSFDVWALCAGSQVQKSARPKPKAHNMSGWPLRADRTKSGHVAAQASKPICLFFEIDVIYNIILYRIFDITAKKSKGA